jgi:RNA polymerase sigma-70 factor (ECF subfamily)
MSPHALREPTAARAVPEIARCPAGVSPARRRAWPAADACLLERAAADPSALALLYDRYARLVRGVALAILGCLDEAEDLTHEVFVGICEHGAYDAERGTPGAFLVRVTRSRAIDRLRRRARSDRLLRSWHAAEAPSGDPRSPFDQIATRRAVERVRGLLAELPGSQRQVLELAYYGGLSQREIAADLATPLGTVKSLSRRALMTLAHALSASPPDAQRALGGDRPSIALLRARAASSSS